MSYQVLARKYRPKNFESLVGQEHVVRALTHALEQQRLHHAYLFTGTRGVGKTTLSRILAKSLNCEKGITAHPCGECEACRAIDAGRFVDYIEMDAASNRGVDEMAQLLEQAVYAPTNARFKVYMIDEVHMLTNHAFNAMLKTLEEPPEHVKFILATTDPQKIPVTVLSRCLQFNLKQMPPGHIISHLENILQQESIAFETPALRLLAQGAHGSMRDALSLTDQAIAYAAGTVTLDAVQGMLGTLDQSYLIRILDALYAQDGATLLGVADEMASRSLSYHTALQDLGTLLHQVAIAQTVPDALADDLPNKEDVLRLAQQFSPEEIQLFYQVVVHGRQELGLAPDEYAGFSMTLLRLLAFIPAASQNTVVPPTALPTPAKPKVAPAPTMNHAAPAPVVSKPAAPVVSPAPVAPPAQVKETAMPLAVPQNSTSHKISPAKAALEAARAAAAHAAHKNSGKPMPAPAAAQPAVAQVEAVSPAPVSVSPPVAAKVMQPAAVPAMVNMDDDDDDDDMPEYMPPWESLAAAPPPSGEPVAEKVMAPVAMPSAAPSEVPDIHIPATPKKIIDRAAHQAEPSITLQTLGMSWPELMTELPLRGVAQQLAQQSELIREDKQGNITTFHIRIPVDTLTSANSDQKLADALTEKIGSPVHITYEVGDVLETASHKAEELREEQLKQAETLILADPFIQKVMQEFDARVVDGSIRPN